MTIILQALSLVGKAHPVQVRFTLRLRDQLSMWMQDGCKSLHGFPHGIKWIIFYGHLDYFQKSPLGGRSNTKAGDHGIPNAHNCWFILFYHVWGPAWIEIHWNSIWLRTLNHIWLHTTLEGPWPHYMILEVCWDGLWTLSIGLSQFHGHGSWLVCEVALS
jgi:hypothetical protein